MLIRLLFGNYSVLRPGVTHESLAPWGSFPRTPDLCPGDNVAKLSLLGELEAREVYIIVSAVAYLSYDRFCITC